MRWRCPLRLATAAGLVTTAAVRSTAAAALAPDTLTTACSQLCASTQTAAAACVSRAATSLAACRTREQISGVVTCAAADATNSSSAALCITPSSEAHTWRFQLTDSNETLALARARAATGKRTDAATAVVVLDAAGVTHVQDVAIPSSAWSLALETTRSPPTLALDTATLSAWRDLETLVITNIDLSAVDALPAFPSLTTLNLTGTQLTKWPLMAATPSLTQLDLSLNALADVPVGSLPVNLRTLNVSRNQLTELPGDISRMRYLGSLAASSNNLSALERFPMILSLNELYLASASLTSVPAGLTVLPAIKILDLSRNPELVIRANTIPAALLDLFLRDCGLSAIPAEFRGEKLWRTIDLSENPIASSELETIRFQTSHLHLERIDLSAIPAIAVNWSVSTTLSLSRNPLGDVDAASLPANITTLWMDECGLTNVPPNLPSLKQLKTLSLSGNPIRTVAPGALPTNLVELHLSNCSLSAAPDDLASSSASLRTLDLSGNAIERIDLRAFQQLERLSLQNNALTTFPLEVFTLTKLRAVDLRGNKFRSVSLTRAQLSVLATRFDRFAVDASVFQTACSDPALVRGTYAICERSGDSDDSSLPGPAPVAPSDSGPSKTRLIVLIASASVSVVLLVVLSVVLLRKRSRAAAAAADDFIFTTARHGVTIDSSDDHALVEWRIDAEELLPIRRLAVRPYGSIWLAHYLSETVIVKRINQKHISARAQQDFIRRLSILARLDHPHILRFLGVAWTTEVDVQVVVEYMRTGNLRRYLTLTKDDPVAKDWTSRKVAIALSIAHALVYIHSRRPQVLHRDLKSRCVLLDDDLTAKVSGFGLRHYSSSINRTSVTATSPKSNRSIAPEVLAGESDYTEEADLYAFGIILSELDTHELPFSDVKLSNGEPLTEHAMLQLLVAGALQPTVSPTCPKEVGALMYDCLAFNPDHRPTAVHAVQRLQSTMEHLQRLSEIGDDIVSSDERMDSFLGVDTSRPHADSTPFSVPQSSSSSGRDMRSTADRQDAGRTLSASRDHRSASSSHGSLRNGASVVRFSDAISYKF